jgi:hypothetical protein
MNPSTSSRSKAHSSQVIERARSICLIYLDDLDGLCRHRKATARFPSTPSRHRILHAHRDPASRRGAARPQRRASTSRTLSEMRRDPNGLMIRHERPGHLSVSASLGDREGTLVTISGMKASTCVSESTLNSVSLRSLRPRTIPSLMSGAR